LPRGFATENAREDHFNRKITRQVSEVPSEMADAETAEGKLNFKKGY
jgi:hypothetical protein